MEKKLNEKICREWYKNKNVNPLTKRAISTDGRLYKDIKRACSKYKNLSLSDDKKDNDVTVKIDKKDIMVSTVINTVSNDEEHYPSVSDPDFRNKLNQLNEFSMCKYPIPSKIKDLDDFENSMSNECLSGKGYDKAVFQYFVQQYMSLRTPYKGLFLYYSVGTGKTCAAVSIAETMLSMHKLTDGPVVYVILPPALKSTFMHTIMDGDCIESVYSIVNETSKAKRIVAKRYHILTYGEFVKMNPELNNNTVIVDEAHNLRNKDTDDVIDDKENKAYDVLMARLKEGTNNRLILMSATPMYNEPSEIADLLNLLLVNEGKDTIKYNDMKSNTIAELSSRYISYINSNNPFVYAQKFTPSIARSVSTVLPYGYIPVKLSKMQVELHKKIKQEDIYLQGFSIANMGISVMTLFNKKKNTYTYRNNVKSTLYPDKSNLGLYSPKILKICESIKTSKGIVLVYSRFLMDGVLPLALALEHMGYSRYQNDNLLEYKGLKRNGLNYAILTSPNPEYIGNMMNFDKILAGCNSKENTNGDVVKVILITKKASEGLSFMNVREIHVLDPWFHMSRIEQIVGRGVRRCSHVNLALKDRNVLVHVYMGYIKDIITADEHAIKISEKKFKDSQRINEIIAKNSIDCVLNKYINNVPRDVFENINPVKMITSQGEEILYMFGNESTIECDVDDLPKISQNLREDTMSMVATMIKKIVRVMKSTRWISMYELKERCKIYDGDDRYFYYAVQKSVAPHKVMNDGSLLFYGNNGLYRRVDKPLKVMEIKLKEKEEIKENVDIQKILSGITKIDDDFNMMYYAYETITDKNWNDIAIEIINHKDKFKRLYDMFVSKGAIIDTYFVDIFNSESNIFDIHGKDVDVATRDKLRKDFDTINVAAGITHGSLIPLKGKIQFKIHEKNNKGAVCITKQRNDIVKRIDGKISNSENRKQLCIRIAKELNDKNKLIVAPNMFPRVKK